MGAYSILQRVYMKIMESCETILKLVLLVLLIHGSVDGYPAERQLIAKLFHEDNYDTNERPALGPDEPVVVHMLLTMHKLIELNGRSQILTTNVWKRMKWTDYRLRWNPAEYNGTEELRVAGNKIWQPDMTLYDDVAAEHDDRREYFSAQLKYDGSVVWAEPGLLTSHCDLNVSTFPFDRQICKLKFGSWTSDTSKISIANDSDIDVSEFNPNGEWDLRKAFPRHNRRRYNCCEHPFDDVTYCIVLKRRPLFYIFNLVLPCIFITATTILVFYLPPESGEKVSLSVTVLLATTVFLLLVAEAMPPQSEVIPLISQYFATTVILMTMSTILTVCVTNLQYRGTYNAKVPQWVWSVIVAIATIVCMKKMVKRYREREEKPEEKQPEVTLTFKRDLTRMSCRSIGSFRHRANSWDSSLSPYDYTYQNSPYQSAPYQHVPYQQNGAANHNIHMRQQPQQQEVAVSSTDNLLQRILTCLEGSAKQASEERVEERLRSDWVIVATVVDRVLMLVFFVVTILATTVILMQRPQESSDVYDLCQSNLRSLSFE